MYEAYITTLKNVRKHSNADKLQEKIVKIQGYNNYLISNFGYVISTKGHKKILKSRKDKDGYLVLELSKKHEFKDATTFELLSNPKEIDLIKYIGEFPSVVSDAAKTFSPYKITNYVQKLAQLFHTFYNECKVIDSTNEELSSQRLALVKASKIVIRNALNLVGVSAPNKM